MLANQILAEENKICNIVGTQILQLIMTLVSPSSNVYRACFLQTKHMSLNGVVNVSVLEDFCILAVLMVQGEPDSHLFPSSCWLGTSPTTAFLFLNRPLSSPSFFIYFFFPSLQVFLHFFHTRADFF